MKTSLSVLKSIAVLSIGLLSLSAPAVTLTITPSTISNTYSGTITLDISSGLTNGETVLVQKYVDINTNNAIDANDLLIQQFQLTDGQASVIGGVTNINVPGDTDATGSHITSVLNFGLSGFDQLFVGKYFFRLSSPVSHFTAVTNSFTVTNYNFGQQISGSVVNSGTNVPNASVILLSFLPSGDQTAVAGTIANNSGAYSIKMPVGTYSAVAFKSNYLGNFATAPIITLSNGATVTTNLTVTNATQSITGKFVDSTNSSKGIPGMLFPLNAKSNGYAPLAFTDTNGNFTARVLPDIWKIKGNGTELNFYGYLLGDKTYVDTSTGSVSGVTISLPKATALFYGTVKDNLNTGLAGVEMFANDQDTYIYEADGVHTDQNGNYVAGALAGTWYVSASNDSASNDPNSKFANYVFQQGTQHVFSVGQAYQYHFTALPATNHITGYLHGAGGAPLSGVAIHAYATIGGKTYQTPYAQTDGSGNYSLNVPNGTCYVFINCCTDCDDGLPSGYQCPDTQFITINNNNGVVNFTAIVCGALDIATTSLSNAQLDNYYQFQLQASGCDQSLSWDLAPGSASLPPGMTLDGNGLFYGTPTSTGAFNFIVRVTDSSLTSDTQALSLTVTGSSVPLQIDTFFLDDAVKGTFYSKQLQASGGQSPYSWSLSPGSAALPPNLGISASGIISGTPVTNGSFDFFVRVTDSSLDTVDQEFSLFIANPPLQWTTTSLSNGVAGVAYSMQLAATGGQTPYTFALAPGSAALPATLTLSASGLISGTPATNATSFVILRVTDFNGTFTNKTFSILVHPKARLSSPARISANQFQFFLSGGSNQSYILQYATTLSNWTSFLTSSAPGGSFTVTNLNATNPARFYRALQGP